MNFFLDTNVMLGYVFETDNWNSKSIEVFQHSATKYSCHYARDECGRKYNTKLQIILRELRKFQKKLRLAKSYQEIEAFIENEHFITEDILIKYLKKEKNSDLRKLANNFSDLQLKSEKKCHENYNHILNKVLFHKSRYPHKEIANELEACGLLEDDADDFEIIIDAHDLGLMVEELFFITGDYAHIIPRKEIILKKTSINNIIGLGEFNYT